MKKIAIGVLMVLLLAGQAEARRPKAGGYGAAGPAAGLRMNAAINRAALGKKSALPPEAAKSQSRILSKASPGSTAEEAVQQGGALQLPGDRPFDGNPSVVNPFAPPAPLPGSPGSPPVSLIPTTNPFVSASSAPNPFQGGLSNPMPFTPSAPGFSLPVVQSNAATNAVGVPTPRSALQPAAASPSPGSNPDQTNSASLLNLDSSSLNLYQGNYQDNPYSLQNLFPKSSPVSP